MYSRAAFKEIVNCCSDGEKKKASKSFSKCYKPGFGGFFFYLNRSSVVAVVRAAQICGER